MQAHVHVPDSTPLCSLQQIYVYFLMAEHQCTYLSSPDECILCLLNLLPFHPLNLNRPSGVIKEQGVSIPVLGKRGEFTGCNVHVVGRALLQGVCFANDLNRRIARTSLKNCSR